MFGWTKSKNMWFRRASAVCLIPSLRKGKYLDQAFKTADILMKDKEDLHLSKRRCRDVSCPSEQARHDLVQKGYGWMLKEASKNFQEEVFEYVMKNRNRMTRTALRYSIEKMPANMKRQAMKQLKY